MKLLSMIACAVFVGGCNSITGASNVTYSVTSGGRVSITYADGPSTEQLDATTPWSRSITADRGDFLYISAQKDGSAGCVRVEIKKGSTTVDSAQSCGAFVIASASGTN